MHTYDCDPILTDSEVLDFCKKGFIVLDGVMPKEINERVIEECDEAATEKQKNSLNGKHETWHAAQNNRLNELLKEDWFKEDVLCNPTVAGTIRSILGKDFALPQHVSNHRSVCPMPIAQDWHWDGGSRYGFEPTVLLCFYLPQGCPPDMGPTEILPSSHFMFSPSSRKGHYGEIKGSYYAIAQPGSWVIMMHSLWHRRSASSGTGIRNNLKLSYWRTTQPKRDWITEPDFLRQANYSYDGLLYSRRPTRDARDAAEMFFWMSGLSDKFEWHGGQGWPATHHSDAPEHRDTPLGTPAYLGGYSIKS